MNKIRRFFNQNRKTILVAILFIAFFIIILQVLNYWAGLEQEKNRNSISSRNDIFNQTTYKPSQSVITKQEVNENEYKIQSNVIDTFFSYCNSANVQNAYNLLSDECKEEMFPTLEYFKENYYDKIFATTKLYTIQNWNNSTYRVKMKEDILSTGKVNNNEITEDYFTVVYSTEGYKLNINNYIGKVEINKENEYKNIKLKVLSKNTYIDYEIYNLSVENKTENDILLDSREKTDCIYLKDSKDVEYPSYSHELIDSSLIVRSGGNSNLSVKFTNSYVESRTIKILGFSDIILNYYEYRNISDKKQYMDRLKIEVDL